MEMAIHKSMVDLTIDRLQVFVGGQVRIFDPSEDRRGEIKSISLQEECSHGWYKKLTLVVDFEWAMVRKKEKE